MLAFIHTPKTGGNTIDYILRKSFGKDYCYTQKMRKDHSLIYRYQDFNKIKWVFPSLKCIGGHYIKYWCDLDKFYKGTDIYYFTFLRDPVKRAISQYYQFNKIGRYKSLDDFLLADDSQNRQLKYLSKNDSLEEAINIINKPNFVMVGLTEFFDESLEMLQCFYREFYIDISYVRPLNRGNYNTASNDIIDDKKSINKIIEANKKDIRLYEYVKNDHFLRQVAKKKRIYKKYPNNRFTSLDVDRNLKNYFYKDTFFYKPLARALSRQKISIRNILNTLYQLRGLSIN